MNNPVIAAPVLPEVLPPRKRRGPVALFIRRYPNIAIGGFLVFIIVGIAIFAPVLGTIDPTELSPIQRTSRRRNLLVRHRHGGAMLYSRVLYGTGSR